MLGTSPRFEPLRVLRGQIGAALVGLLAVASVLVTLNAAADAPLLQLRGEGRRSLAWVMTIMTGLSAAGGWLSTFQLWFARVGRVRVDFDWPAASLTVTDDDGAQTIPFADILGLTLHESPSPRPVYTLEVLAEHHPPRVIFQTEGASDHREPLSLMIDLARALGVSWRCAADADAALTRS